MTDRSALWGLPDPDSQSEFYAGIPMKRAVAWALDTAVIIGLSLLVVFFTLGIGFFFFAFIFLIVGFAYRVLTIAGNSATWGMRLVAIELRTGKGERFDMGRALMHTLGYSLSVAFVFPQIVSMALMAFSARGQGLSDMVLSTAMVNRSATR